MKKGHRLRAPSADGSLLAVPPLREVCSRFHSRCSKVRRLGSRFSGPSGRLLRGLVHHEVMVAACKFLRRTWSGRSRGRPVLRVTR